MRKRWLQHLKDLKDGTHSSDLMLSDYAIYGPECFRFRVLRVFEEPDSNLLFYEQEFIDKLVPAYNTKPPLGRLERCLKIACEEVWSWPVEKMKEFIDDPRSFRELTPEEQAQRQGKIRTYVWAREKELYLQGACQRGRIGASCTRGPFESALDWRSFAKATQKHSDV